MELIATLLVFGFVFYVLMRWGCGGRMVHGLHPARGAALVDRDPVCGMRVEPGEGLLAEHGGHVYRFCSTRCLEQFHGHPEIYASGGAPAPPQPRKEA